MSTLRDSAVNQRICSKLVEREVGHCVSSLISHFAQHPEALEGSGYTYEDDLLPILTQDDWESAWTEEGDAAAAVEYMEDYTDAEGDINFRGLCELQRLDPHVNEAYEHWIVSKWFAEKLEAQGEMIGELFGLKIWGRCTTGQSISMDRVIFDIAGGMEILEGQKHSWAE